MEAETLRTRTPGSGVTRGTVGAAREGTALRLGTAAGDSCPRPRVKSLPSCRLKEQEAASQTGLPVG